MSTFWTGLLQFLLGAGGLALLSILQERWRWKHDRKAHKEDKAEEYEHEREVSQRHCEDTLVKISKDLEEYIKRQDEFDGKLVKRMEDMEAQNAAQNEGMKHVLLDRILYLGQSYIKKGEVTFDERKRLGDMHNVYHKRLEGNGDADAVMDAVYNLPLSQKK
jgi:phosphoenolpyruvate synthase/pyruvate phosphate dikinase